MDSSAAETVGPDAIRAAAWLRAGAADPAWAFCLQVEEYVLRVRSNTQALHELLVDYLAPFQVEDRGEAEELLVLERATLPAPADLQDWPREAGKTGRKDSYLDLVDGRLLRKVRSGMMFLQSPALRIAAGPCQANASQVVNFINSQYLNHCQQQGWLLCHAAALWGPPGVLAIAGCSGGGKSSLMLRLLARPGWRYVTNDRLLIRRGPDGIEARGIPKWPRINPGTLVGNPRLHALASDERLAAWRAMDTGALWNLEQKHDVPVESLYGTGRLQSSGRLCAMLVLHWERGGSSPVGVHLRAAEEVGPLLPAVMKCPGPFYIDAGERFLAPGRALDPARYRDMLEGVSFYEVVGRVDFAGLEQALDAHGVLGSA